jgi:hypothetical protein
MKTKQLLTYEQQAQPQPSFQGVATIGTVVDTNDPQQMGRIRIVCAVLGEGMSSKIEDIPWAVYVSPFAGQTEAGTRGTGPGEHSEGAVGYGFWARPKIGSQVVVMFIDGDPNFRISFGAIYDQFRPHTMPHGRFMYEDHPGLEQADDRRPFGPYTSNEKYIEPLNTNMREAFPKSEPNYEWRTRVADYQVSAVDVAALQFTTSNVPDDKNAFWDGWFSTQGYEISRQDPTYPGLYDEGNLDSEVYSWTTPGFHAISMDDSTTNCRTRFRTTGGHQILMDDTNERIYVATAKGNNWIEMDQAGNIDIYTSNKVNIHAAQDINLTSDQAIRMYGAQGIHMYSGTDIRAEALQDVHFKFHQNWRVNVTQNTYLNSNSNTNIKAGGSMYLEAASNIEEKAGSNLDISAGSNLTAKAQTNFEIQGFDVSIRGDDAIKYSTPNWHTSEIIMYHSDCIISTSDCNAIHASVVSTAAGASSPSELPTFWTSRVPQHEPWPRVMTANNFTHNDEFLYTSPQVNRNERGVEIPRGKFWRR